LPPPGQARPDWIITRDLAALLGAEWLYGTIGGVLAEMAQAIPLYAGLSYERLSQPVPLSRRMAHYIYAGMSFQAEAREGVQWPTQAEASSTKLPLTWADPLPQAAHALPKRFTLATPRVLYDGGNLLGQAEILGTHLVQPHVALARADAQALGVANGEIVQVSADGRQVALPARVDGLVPQGVVAIPRNLPGQPAEQLLGDEQVSGEVEVVTGR